MNSDGFDLELLLFGRLLIGSGFVVSAGLKFKDMKSFLRAVSDYRLLPSWLLLPSGFTLAALELVLGLFLLTGLYIGAFALTSATLLGAFTTIVSFKLAKGQTVRNCGCFGELQPEGLHWTIVVRNVIFIGLALYLALREGFSTVIAPLPMNSSLLPTVLLVIAAALIIFLTSYVFEFLGPLSLLPRRGVSPIARRS